MSKNPGLAAAVESFVGIRIPLPNGKTFVAGKVLFFLDALRWQELLERYQMGGAGNSYSETLKVIVSEMPTILEVEDMSVVHDLELGEFLDHVVYSFFSHRRSLPGWVQLLKQQDPAPQNAKLPPPATSSSSPSPT